MSETPTMKLPHIGDVIRFTTKTARYGRGLEVEQRLGRVVCVWGMTEGDEVIDTDNGSCHLSCGDTWRLAASPAKETK